MATKLKNMKLTSVDLVKQGANQKAHFKILKSAEGGETEDMSFMAKLKKGLDRVLGVRPNAEQLKELAKSIEVECDPYAVMEEALKKSTIAILKDKGLSDDDKQSMLEVSIEQFCKALKEENEEEPEGPEEDPEEPEEPEEDPEKEDLDDEDMEKKKCETKKGETSKTLKEQKTKGEEALMEMDVTKMNAEDRKTAEALVAKYTSTKAEDHTLVNEMHPEVKKALEEVEELKKQLEMNGLMQVAKKYEILGKKPEELSAKLYELKKAGGSAYDDYVAVLDELVTSNETSGLFKELGSSRSGKGADLNEIVKGIREKEPGLTPAEAICKAYEQNPGLDPFTGKLNK